MPITTFVVADLDSEEGFEFVTDMLASVVSDMKDPLVNIVLICCRRKEA